MIWLSLYLYFIGSAMMWCFVKPRDEGAGPKFIAVVFWPIIVPIASLF